MFPTIHKITECSGSLVVDPVWYFVTFCLNLQTGPGYKPGTVWPGLPDRGEYFSNKEWWGGEKESILEQNIEEKKFECLLA